MLLRYYLILGIAAYLCYKIGKFVKKYFERKHRYMKYVKHLECPKGFPFFGNAFKFIGKNTEEIMHEGVAFTSSRKTPFYGWFLGFLVMIIDRPEDAHTVLTSKSCIEKAPIYKFFNRGMALFTAPAHIWRPQRKILNTAFNLKILQSFIPIFNNKVTFLVRNINEMVGKGTFDVSSLMHACTLDMVCSTTMGANFEIQNGQNSDYVEALANSLASIAKRIVNVFYHFDFIYKRSQLCRDDRKYTETYERLPQQVIDSRKIEYFKNNPMTEDQTENDEKMEEVEAFETPQIFIDQLFRLHSKGIIDDKAIKDQVNLAIFAGNDTSALTLSNATLLLAMHPQVQERLFEEVDRVFDGVPLDAPVNYDQILQLTYTEQVIKETLRLFPVSPYVLRFCKSDTEISNCTIPRGAVIIVSLYTMHRNKEIWGEDANEFNPDHFSAEQMSKRHPSSYAPFSLGPRNCIGMRYAYISMKIMLATLMRQFKFTTDLKMSDIKMRFEITMKFVCGNMVKVERRH